MEFTRRSFFKRAGAATAAVTLSPVPGRATEKLNFVLVNVDDLGWTDLGCYGSRYYETPHIDRLAAAGVRFTHAYAAGAVCSPTRAAIMTGRYPARLGITDWIRARFQGGAIPADKRNPAGYDENGSGKLLTPQNPLWMELEEVTIAEVLEKAGYVCCHIGKWHLGADDWYPEQQGFHFNFGGCDYGQPPSYFDPYRKDDATPGIPGLPPRMPGEYLTDREADEAVAFINAHEDRPFFLNLNHYAVHTPIQGKQALIDKYEAKPKTNQRDATYAAMVESVDDAVGAVGAALDRLGLRQRTVILFTSDNGGLDVAADRATSNRPLRAGKGYPYEGGIRIPLIVCGPGIPSGRECAVPTTSVDLLPTLCALAQAPLPQDRPIDGISIVPLLRGGDSLERDAIYWHFPHYRGGSAYGDIMPYSIVRSGDWKLIKQYDGKPFELFDLNEDPTESRDLSEELPDRVAALNAKLERWLLEVGAKLPKPNPGA